MSQPIQHSHPAQIPPSPSTGAASGRAKTFVMALLIIGLASTNLLTLLNDDIHESAYRGIAGVLGPIIAEATLTRLLSHSPVEKRVRAVGEATKALSEKTATLAREHEALKKVHESTKLAKASLEVEHGRLKGKVLNQAKAVKVFAKRVAVRIGANATRNVGSIFGEAIPFIGAGVVVAVTLLDVYDACETMKDLTGLAVEFGNVPHDDDRNEICGIKVPTRDEALKQATTNSRAAYKAAVDVVNAAGSKKLPTEFPSIRAAEMTAAVCKLSGERLPMCR